MIKNVSVEGKNIRYQILGEGKPVLLLHGYLEILEVWDGFAEQLAKHFQVIRIDIPGHGDSEVFGEVHTMNEISDRIFKLLDQIGIKNIDVVGHSMGGYVAMAMAKLDVARVSSLVLFHSAPFADTDEKKRARLREIELIKQSKRIPLYQVNIPNMFAQDQLDKFRTQIGTMQILAKRLKSAGIMALVKGMMDRENLSALLPQLKHLVILGKKDEYIPFEIMKTKLSDLGKVNIETLENSGHAGFIEEPKRSLEIVKHFLS